MNSLNRHSFQGNIIGESIKQLKSGQVVYLYNEDAVKILIKEYKNYSKAKLKVTKGDGIWKIES